MVWYTGCKSTVSFDIVIKWPSVGGQVKYEEENKQCMKARYGNKRSLQKFDRDLNEGKSFLGCSSRWKYLN